MANLKESGLSLLGSATIDGQTTASKQTIYTPPSEKSYIPIVAVVRNQSASLAGLVDMDLGSDANASNWLLEISLDAFTATTDYGELRQPVQAAGPPIVPEKQTVHTGAFGAYITTGSTGAATFTVEIWGYEF